MHLIRSTLGRQISYVDLLAGLASGHGYFLLCSIRCDAPHGYKRGYPNDLYSCMHLSDVYIVESQLGKSPEALA